MCGLTQVLVFIESALEKKREVVCACWSFLIGEHISMWMSPFCFESPCARDGGMWWIQRWGGPYLVVGVRGILLPWVILRRERRHDHIWISNIFGDVSSGVGLCPNRTYGRGIPIYGDAATPRVFGVHTTDHSLLLTY